MKKILLVLAGLAAAIIIAACARAIIWYNFKPPQIVGDTIESSGTDLEALSRRWFKSYADKLKDWKVPYSYRIREARIDSVKSLTDIVDLETGIPLEYIQIDYTVYPASENEEIISNLELIDIGQSYVYQGQMILKWRSAGENQWVIEEKLSPVQYQLQMPETQEEIHKPQTKHYKVKQDEPMTYYIADGVLYVTYDSGDTYIEVPGGYEKVCSNGNGLYEELLPGNSYVVTPGFTAFVGYTPGAVLIYSTDQGATWQESPIYQSHFSANTFLSKTETKCYVTIAIDRVGGSDYYATFCSEDLLEWTRMDLPEMFWSNLKCVYWAWGGRGYYAKGENLYTTEDGGVTYTELSFPAAEETVVAMGYNPFDAVEEIYEENGLTYMIVGQGDDGDYARDGKIVKALYQSQDGMNFTFVSEVDNIPEEAG